MAFKVMEVTYLDLLVLSDLHTVKEKVVEALQMKVEVKKSFELVGLEKATVICLAEVERM